MNLDDFKERQYLNSALEVLLGEHPPAAEEGPTPADVIEQVALERDAQVNDLVLLMFSPRTLPDGKRPSGRSRGEGLDRELRSPRTSARLFVDQRIRTGKSWAAYPERALEQLPGDGAVLFSALRLLADAAATPTIERKGLLDRWLSLTMDASLGPVLDAIDGAAKQQLSLAPPTTHDPDRLTRAVTARLSETRVPTNDVTSRIDELGVPKWCSEVARTGGRRLLALMGAARR